MENHGKDTIESISEEVVNGQNKLKDFFENVGWDPEKALIMMAYTSAAIMYNNDVVDERTKYLFQLILKDAKDGKIGSKKK